MYLDDSSFVGKRALHLHLIQDHIYLIVVLMYIVHIYFQLYFFFILGISVHPPTKLQSRSYVSIRNDTRYYKTKSKISTLSSTKTFVASCIMKNLTRCKNFPMSFQFCVYHPPSANMQIYNSSRGPICFCWFKATQRNGRK